MLTPLTLWLKQQWRQWLLAVGFFTRIPVPTLPDFNPQELNAAAKYFPLVGWLVALAGAAVYTLAYPYFPAAVTVLLSMAATIYLTGAFHEDGLADSADGLGGGYTPEKILAIMQDSRIGTYGMVTLGMVLLLKFQALAHLAHWVAAALLIAHPLSRLSALWLMARLPYVKPAGKAKPLATQIAGRALLAAHVFGLLPLLAVASWLHVQGYPALRVLGWLAAVLLPVIAFTLWWQRVLQRALGGYTGDTLGACQQLTEVAIYLSLLGYQYAATAH